MSCRHGAAALSLLLAGLTLTGAASADRRTEKAAQDALTRASDDYLKMDFAKALRRLQLAERACGEAACAPTTHAALLRDMGTMQFRLGRRDLAIAAFRRARTLDPSMKLNPDYDAKDLRDAWEPVVVAPPKPTAVASGVASTPLPIYIELDSAEVVSVAAKYKNDSMRAFRRVVLKRIGNGWGGYVPCADVVTGTLHYYVQGFDKDNEVVASSGDANRTFDVTISEGGEAPVLPGDARPPKCADGDQPELDLGEGERCTDDRQCKSGACAAGHCKALKVLEQEDATAGGARPFARFWIGIAGMLDLTAPPSTSEVCAAGGTSGYWCTTPDGKDLPSSGLVPGQRGTSSSSLTPGGVHIMAALDYALTANALVGARLGYVANAFPGDAASSAGKTISPRIHLEARGTWVFGDEPIARSGLAAYVFGSLGVARFDAPVTVMVASQGVAGDRAVQAWHVAGPAFVAIGGGARYALSPRLVFSTGLGFYAAFAPGAFGATVSPELNLQYGF